MNSDINPTFVAAAVTDPYDTAMTAPVCLANAMLVLGNRVMHGRVTLSDGKISAIDEGPDVPAGAVDCGGDVLMPGLIELHTDNLERHIQPRPGVDWPHDAAILAHDAELAVCGITTVFDAMRVGSVVSDTSANYAKYARGLVSELLALRKAGALRINHLIHLRAEVCSETLIAELDEFGTDDAVGLISLMDHTPGQRQFRDLEKLRAYVCGKHGLSEAGFADHVARQKALQARLGAAHEAAAVAAAGRMGAVLASHDDTTAAQVQTSAGLGIRLAEFPTTIEAASACRAAGIAVIMGAPNLIRGGSHSGNVAAAELARADLLDILSSDYVPAGLIQAAFALGEIWNDLPRAIATVTATPAQATGLTDRGSLAIGLRADIIRVGVADVRPRVCATWVAGVRVA
jgi:alpha-D-ribose 1-methylphosphonate 5-triphosphate diphosphatase